MRGAGVIAALLVHQFVSRAGQRAAFFAMPAAIAVAMFALAGVDSLWVYVVFLGVGMVAGMQNPVLASYVNRRIPSERRATMLSVQSVIASFLLAGIEPLCGVLADQFGLQGMFLAMGLIVAVFGTGVLVLWNRAETDALKLERGSAPARANEPVTAS